jgi:hypothetical protein
MISPTILFSASVYWALFSPQKVIEKDPRLFLWTMGVVFSNIAVHLIIAQMSSTRSETVNFLLRIYLIVAGLACTGVFADKELIVLKLTGIYMTLAHLYYGICLVTFELFFSALNNFRCDSFVTTFRLTLSIWIIWNARDVKSKAARFYVDHLVYQAFYPNILNALESCCDHRCFLFLFSPHPCAH